MRANIDTLSCHGTNACMEQTRRGALPLQMITALVERGVITSVDAENINPASLDLALSDEIYRVPGVVQPRPHERVHDLMHRIGGIRHDLSYQLEPGASYIARLKESVALPPAIYGYTNPKSTTGRHDVHARVLQDGVSRYDTLHPSGEPCELWVAITPRSYPVVINPGESLAQARFFVGTARIGEQELREAMDEYHLLWSEREPIAYDTVQISDRDGSLILTLDLAREVAGYECINPAQPLAFAERNHDPYDFYRHLTPHKGILHLMPGRFYILSTKEFVRVPPQFACEMRPMDDRSGEFRAHYAGFIDPGWGWGADGEGRGWPLTLEVRPYEPIIVGEGQPFAKIVFERMMIPPSVLYETKKNTHYSGQVGPRLAKQFKNPF